MTGAELPVQPRGQHSTVVCGAWKLTKHCHPQAPPGPSPCHPQPEPVGSFIPLPLGDPGLPGLSNGSLAEPMSPTVAVPEWSPAGGRGASITKEPVLCAPGLGVSHTRHKTYWAF